MINGRLNVNDEKEGCGGSLMRFEEKEYNLLNYLDP